MTISLFPVSCTAKLSECRDFYKNLLDLEVIFEADWYVQLQDPGNSALQIAFVLPGHDSLPNNENTEAAGVVVTIEHDNVDAIHQRAARYR